MPYLGKNDLLLSARGNTVENKTASFTLTPNDNGKLFGNSGSAGHTITVPATSGFSDGFTFGVLVSTAVATVVSGPLLVAGATAATWTSSTTGSAVVFVCNATAAKWQLLSTVGTWA